jgi:hypothetical protein
LDNYILFNREELKEALREGLQVTVEFRKSRSYSDSDVISTKIYFDEEFLNEFETYPSL